MNDRVKHILAVILENKAETIDEKLMTMLFSNPNGHAPGGESI